MNIQPRYNIGERVAAYGSDVFPLPITGEITKINTSIAIEKGLPAYNRYKINGRWFFEIDIAREDKDFLIRVEKLVKELKCKL